MQNCTKTEYVYAGFWVRLAAFLIDQVCISFALFLVRILISFSTSLVGLNVFDTAVLFEFSVIDISLYLMEVIYYILMTYYTGSTLGKYVMNLRVIQADTGEKPEFLDVVYRETIGRFLSGFFINAGYIMAGIDKEKRGLHDILSDTRVIYAKKIKVYPTMNPINPIYPQPIPAQPFQQVHHGPIDNAYSWNPSNDGNYTDR